MNEDYNDPLHALFAEADKPLPPEDFVAQMMKQLEPRPIDKFFRILVAVLLLGGAWLVATTVSRLLSTMNELVLVPIMELGDSSLAAYLAPLNSPLSLLTLAGFGVWFMWKHIREI